MIQDIVICMALILSFWSLYYWFGLDEFKFGLKPKKKIRKKITKYTKCNGKEFYEGFVIIVENTYLWGLIRREVEYGIDGERLRYISSSNFDTEEELLKAMDKALKYREERLIKKEQNKICNIETKQL